MASPSLSDRLVSALMSAVLGAVIGGIVAWLLGIYSNTLGPAFMQVSFASWIVGGALVFGVLGALFGTSMGSVIGQVLTAIFAFERLEQDHFRWWGILVLLVGGVIFMVWAQQALGSK